MRSSAARWVSILLFFVLTSSFALATDPARFAPPTKYLVGNRPSDIVAADLNGDGKIDLVVTTQGDANVYVLLGHGDGTFANPVAYPVGTGRVMDCAVADFNGDGKLDVAVVTGAVTGSTPQVLVLLGNGDGTFSSTPIASSVNTSPISLKAADINGDGTPDLLVGGNGSANVLLGNGNGTFAAPIVLNTPNSSSVFSLPYIAAGDFNGDGRLDVVSIAGGPSIAAIVVFLQNADGTFQAGKLFQHASYSNTATGIAIADLNRDGFVDVVAMYDGFADVYAANGDGTFVIPTTSQYLGTTPVAAAFADFNGDGSLDIAAADYNSSLNGTPDGFGVTVMPIAADGSFVISAFAQFDVGAQATAIAVADLNGDGKPDIIVAEPATNSISVLLNGRDTLVTLTASPNPAMPNTAVVLTATVAAASGNATVATGSVAFYNNNALVGSAQLDPTATATITINNPANGYHTITALYFGDAQHIGSSAPPVYLSVGYPTTTTLTYSPPSPKQGQTITFTATAASNYGNVNPGYVYFYDGTKNLGYVNLSNGTATFQTTALALGQHTIKATYSPAYTTPPSSLLSSSASVTFAVAFNSATTVTAASSTPRAGSPVSLSAAVSSFSGVPTGNVTFSDGATILGTAALSNGVATITTSNLPQGAQTIHVAYAGDGTYDTASSDLALQVAAPGTNPMAGAFDFVYMSGANLIAYDPVKNRVYAFNPNYARVDVIDAATRTIVGNIPANSVTAMDVSGDGAFLFLGT